MSQCLPFDFVTDEIDIVEAYFTQQSASAHQSREQARRLRRQLRRRRQDHGSAAARRGHLGRDRSWQRKAVKARNQHLREELLHLPLVEDSVEDSMWSWADLYQYEQPRFDHMPDPYSYGFDPYDYAGDDPADELSYPSPFDRPPHVDDYYDILDDLGSPVDYVLPASWSDFLDDLY